MIYSIIVIYNGMRNDWIQKCFDSIINSTVESKIVAIDNSSTDNSVKYIKQNYPNVHLIINKENKGFGGANNQGLSYALDQGGDYFLLLNQDACVDQNTIEELVKISKSNTDYGIISPIHLNGLGTALDYNFSNTIAPRYCKKLYSDFVLSKIEARIYESGFICAAAWLMTRPCLERVGGFNPTFFHYGEDDNYVHRLIYKKLKIGIYPKVFIYHDREERKKSKYFNTKKLNERRLLVDYSNPNLNINYDKEINILSNKIKKHQLLLNFKEANRLKDEKKTLSQIYLTSRQNFEKSIEESKFIFINQKQ